MVNRVRGLFKKLSLQAKLILIGLIPTFFFLFISLQYYQAEKQKLKMLHDNIRLINRAAGVNNLIEQLHIERGYGYEFALKKDNFQHYINQWKYTDSSINYLEKLDPELRGIKTYTMLDGLAGIRQSNSKKILSPDAIMGYYTTTIFRISYLDATPELLMGNAGKINKDINGLKSLSEMNIYLAIINSNIYNVLYTHRNAVGTLYGLIGLYEVYNTFEKEFLIKASPEAIASYKKIKRQQDFKDVFAYLGTSFKRMNIDSTYNDVQWWKISNSSTDQLKLLQQKITSQINGTLVHLESSERNKVDVLLVLLITSMLLITLATGYTIADIRARLTKLRIAAEKIAVGDTDINLSLYSGDVIGRLARSVAKIDENNRMLADAAIAIGSGNFDVHVKLRGDTDLLGNAIIRMKNELQTFTSDKLAHAIELERLLDVIKQSETHFRRIADQTPFMIWQVNNNSDATYVNKKWLTFTGLSFEESLKHSWMVMLHPDDQKERAFTKAFADRVSYTSKARFKNAEGEYRWMYIQGNPVFNNEKFDGFIGSLTDITDQLAAEEAMLELMHKKDEFLSIASHELKTPLTSIKAYTQLLRKNANPGDKSFAFVEKTLKHIARLEKLINDLLDVSRINSGRINYEPEVFQFEDLLIQSVENFDSISSKHKIEVQNTATGKLAADRVRIEQVLNNLLDNAAKYSPDAGTILVNSVIDKGHIIVSVKDYGIGIAKKDWDLLFQRFYRTEKSYNKFQGLGLGLFISSEIIKQHKGRIWVESEPGKGSIFHFSLPLFMEENMQAVH